jgi:putative endonuclease
MPYFVYMLLTKRKSRFISYVGYTSNLKDRLSKHNASKGAKFTKGNKWVLIYSKKYKNKILAMKNEYKLKKNNKLRKQIKNNYLSE